MKKPKLVLFDFGGTLIRSSEFWLEKGMEALRLSAVNPEVTTTKAMCELWDYYYDRLTGREGGPGSDDLEVQLSTVFRNMFALTGLKYEIDLWECEAVFDKHNSDREPTPNMAELLDALDRAGIRTAVISNTVISGRAMEQAVNYQLPNSKMEFVLTSADYLFKKPHGDMFLAAAKISGVKPHDCWYCGDNFDADAGGACNAGMFGGDYDVGRDGGFT